MGRDRWALGMILLHRLRAVSVLARGAALAQFIQLGARPVVTRIDTSKDFALLAIFIAIVGMVTPVVTGSYKMAMVLRAANEILGLPLHPYLSENDQQRISATLHEVQCL